MIFQEDKEFLEHFGVKGMKWGVRRSGGSSSTKGSSTPKKKLTKKQQQEAKKAKIKKAVKIGGTALAIGGAAYALNKIGKTDGSVKNVLSSDAQKLKRSKEDAKSRFSPKETIGNISRGGRIVGRQVKFAGQDAAGGVRSGVRKAGGYVNERVGKNSNVKSGPKRTISDTRGSSKPTVIDETGARETSDYDTRTPYRATKGQRRRITVAQGLRDESKRKIKNLEREYERRTNPKPKPEKRGLFDFSFNLPSFTETMQDNETPTQTHRRWKTEADEAKRYEKAGKAAISAESKLIRARQLAERKLAENRRRARRNR